MGKRMTMLAMAAAIAGAGLLFNAGPSPAQTAPGSASSSTAANAAEFSAQRRRPRREPTRLRIYRDFSYPGPNAVRDCEARYVQEFRPSGTVIVPRVNCFWRPG